MQRRNLATRIHSIRMPNTWNIVDEGAPDHQLATVFSTKVGIEPLAGFVRPDHIRGITHNPNRAAHPRDHTCNPFCK